MYTIDLAIKGRSKTDPTVEYRTIRLRGLFMPKGDDAPRRKIKEQTINYLMGVLGDQNPDKELYVVEFSAKRILHEFIVKEDSPEAVGAGCGEPHNAALV